MKTKEIIQLVAALVIFVVAGFIIYSQLAPKKANGQSKGATVEVITAIPSDFDSNALNKLSDSTKSRDFYSPPDLKSGVGNSRPFVPVR